MTNRTEPVKVVIFCGGLGVRMGEATQRIPKPMIEIGGRPILWHIMRYYAAWGHNDFILCLGYKGEVVKEYFLTYNEALFNDFVLERNGDDASVELLSRDIGDWRITFVDTGVQSTIGGAAQGGRAASRRRRDVPRDLRRRAHGRAAARAWSSAFHDSREDSDRSSPCGPQFNAHLVDRRTTTDRRRRRGHEPVRHPHQRRLLRLPPRDPRPDRAGRRAGRGDVREADRARRARRVPVRRVLRADGHDQGQAAPRGAARVGRRALAQGPPGRARASPPG